MDEIIGKEIDSLGDEVIIHFCNQENMPSSVTAFFFRQWAELVELGFAESTYIPNIASSRIIYATINNEIVGMRMWSWPNSNTTYVILIATDKNFRRRGITTMISNYYDQRIVKGNCKYSKTHIHVNNVPMLEGIKKTGYEIDFVRVVKKYN